MKVNALLIGVTLGFAAGGFVATQIDQAKAIEAGVGEYHPQTGAFQWKTTETKEQQ